MNYLTPRREAINKLHRYYTEFGDMWKVIHGNTTEISSAYESLRNKIEMSSDPQVKMLIRNHLTSKEACRNWIFQKIKHDRKVQEKITASQTEPPKPSKPKVVDKRCPACEQVKPADQYAKNRSRKDGLQGQCKQCMNKKYFSSGSGNKKATTGSTSPPETKTPDPKPKDNPKDKPSDQEILNGLYDLRDNLTGQLLAVNKCIELYE